MTDGLSEAYEIKQWDVFCENNDLLFENDELRKLVADMMRFFEDGDWCDKCNYARECDSQEQYEGDCLMRFAFRDRMTRLGVEVE